MKKELQEAIEAARGLATLLKSQMAFDFTAPTSTPNAHHKAYTRRTRSGGTSQIQARGAQRQEEPVVVQPATPHAGHAIPPPPEVAHLIGQVETAAQGLLTNPAMAPHKAEIEEMISDLKKHPSAKHAKVVVEQMKDLAESVAQPANPYQGNPKKLLDDITGKMKVTYGTGPHKTPLLFKIRHDENMVTITYKNDAPTGRGIMYTGITQQITEQQKAAFAAAAPKILKEIKKKINVEDDAIELDGRASIFFVSNDMIKR